MAKLTYNLERLERCIFSLYDDVKTPEDILKTWNICESLIEKSYDALIAGNALIGGSPTCRIRMLHKPWNWEFICDPPVDDDYSPLWNEVPGDEREIIEGSEDLCSLLLIIAIEGGNPSQFIVDTAVERRDLRPKFCGD